MRKFLLLIAFTAGVATLASAQNTQAPAKGTNPNPDAPVNVADPALRPANPATYSATPVEHSQKAQYYVKDNQPVDAAGNPVNYGSGVSKEELAKKAAEAKAAEQKKGQPAAQKEKQQPNKQKSPAPADSRKSTSTKSSK